MSEENPKYKKDKTKYEEVAQRYYDYMMREGGKDLDMTLSKDGKIIPKDQYTSDMLPHFEEAMDLERRGIVKRYDEPRETDELEKDNPDEKQD